MKVNRADLIPEGWQLQRFEDLEQGTELDLIDLNADLDVTNGSAEVIQGIGTIISGVISGLITTVIVKAGTAIVKAPTKPGVYNPGNPRPPIRSGGGPHIPV